MMLISAARRSSRRNSLPLGSLSRSSSTLSRKHGEYGVLDEQVSDVDEATMAGQIAEKVDIKVAVV